MSDYTVKIAFHAIGYNKKGLVGFVTGGTQLTYMEMVEENKHLADELHLPYISDKIVKETNREMNRRKKDARGDSRCKKK